MDGTTFYEADPVADGWRFKVYHYDETGNREIRDHVSESIYPSKAEAEDAASAYCDEHGIDARWGEA